MFESKLPFRKHLSGLLAGAVIAASGVIALGAPQAAAQPQLPSDPPTVTAQALPTWQVNGVVWSTVVVGNTAYVTGDFSKARPPGAAVNSPLSVDAKNIFAFDVTTGNPVAFNHSLNGQGLVIRANDAGTRLYVGGDFTTVDNVARGHIAAFDLTQPGAPLTSFDARTDGQVRGFALIGDKVYAGGNFRSSNGLPRKLFASYQTETGALTSWAPQGDGGYVWSMVAAPDNSRIIAGGSFTTLNGVSAYGMGSLDASTGATLPWAANQRLRTAGANGAINGLSTDGTAIYGAGYAFGTGATFEGTFSADPLSGEINWMNDCIGDTYDTFPMGNALYTVSHDHNCSAVESFPDTNPRNRWQNASAERIGPPIGTYTTKDAAGWDFIGLPYTGLLHWFPSLAFGNYTSSKQAAWSIGGNDDYLVLGGEFPKVNGVDQQGLTRFAKRGGSTSAKPVISRNATPTVIPRGQGKVRVIFDAMYDRDDATLSYDIYRGTPGSSRRVGTITGEGATFWDTPTVTYDDQGLTAGDQVRYQIRGRDADGNDQWSAWSGYFTVDSNSASAYADSVESDGATHHWRLDESSGSSLMIDAVGHAHGVPNSNMTVGSDGVLPEVPNKAVTSKNSAAITTAATEQAPSTVTVEAWVKTTSSRGGRIIGFGNRATGTSPVTDQVLYLDNSGRPNFSITDTARRTITARSGIRDGAWHHVVGMVGEDGMQLFVDGVRVARDQRFTEPMEFNGSWRIGSDTTTGLPNRPSDTAIVGQLDEVAVYPRALTIEEIQDHYVTSGRSGGWGVRATDDYGQAVLEDAPDLFWRLDEPNGVARDSAGSGQVGNVSGTVTRQQQGPVAGGTAATFNGSNGVIVAQQSWYAPGPFTAEIWFKTNTTRGGKLIGFGNAASGLSGTYDRHVWMQNNGRLAFGVNNGAQQTLTTDASYNDNQWHHVAASQGPDGMRFYIDGVLVGSNNVSDAHAYLGYWRIGGDRVWSGATSSYFAGQLAEAAVYPSVLSEDDVLAHFVAAGRTAPNRPPVAAFTADTSFLEVSLDAAQSADPDGPIASYEWAFGDGTTATGVTASHAYTQAGTYQVSLTVTDPQGLSHTVTQPVTVAANQAPVAAFESTVTGSSVAFDAAASADVDGQIVSYTWAFGDGQTGTGKTVTHDYGAVNTFQVTLTVTDDRGATHSVTKTVETVDIPNQAPTADFGVTVNEFAAAFDASASGDPDGEIVSYAWDFGNGATGTGKTPSYTYASNGSYTVTLTVTDDRGATATTSKTVVINVAPGPVVADSFERMLNGTWGVADRGGAWTIVNGAPRFSTAGGKGKITLVNPGSGVTARLDSVSLAESDMTFDVSMDKSATGGGIYVEALGRTVPGVGSYSANIHVLSTGVMQAVVMKTVGTTETNLANGLLTGLTYTGGETLHVRLQVTGSGSTQLKLKVWKGDTEPTNWQLSATDSTSALQAPGGIGLSTYVSGSSTSLPLAYSFDNLQVRQP